MRIYSLLSKIWNEEVIPTDWRDGLLMPIFKKGNPGDCNNYRGIMLLNTTYKILASIIRKRLDKHVEEKIGEY